MFRHSIPKHVLCYKQTIQLAETDHVICLSQSHGLFTTKYKFWFTMLKHFIDGCTIEGLEPRATYRIESFRVNPVLEVFMQSSENKVELR